MGPFAGNQSLLWKKGYNHDVLPRLVLEDDWEAPQFESCRPRLTPEGGVGTAPKDENTRSTDDCISSTFQLFLHMGLKAYAKINLGLRILRKRNDGYHDIETIFHRIDLFDEVTFLPSQDVSLSSSDSGLPTDERNLCVRAAESLRRRCNVDTGVRILLKKNIPVGAGLGGGSSDAAATLLGLVRFWKLKISDEELLSIALQLGSDVPYFLKSGTARATGRGEVLEYFFLDVPSWIVLVYPNVQVSTAWAYAEHDRPNENGGTGDGGDRLGAPISLKQIVCNNIARPRLFNTLLRNDLEPVVFPAHENLAGLKQALFDAGAEFAQMSGSGSSVYGFFSDERLVSTAAEKLAIHYRVFITQPHFQPVWSRTTP